jgi:hypothetical protein
MVSLIIGACMGACTTKLAVSERSCAKVAVLAGMIRWVIVCYLKK